MTGPPSLRQIGKYIVLDVIGAGGMGIVYRAQDPAIGRTVAIKMLRPRGGDASSSFDRFFSREMKSTGNLNHKNIVTVYDSGEQDGSPYLVMEYLEGEPVSRLISERRSISLLDKLDVIIQVCDGLQYAHDRNIIHRDIKPANVILLSDGTAKLVDFGVARIADSDTSLVATGQIIGSVSYMSPEQINSLPIDGRSDIFSTGVMLYELLTFEMPFKGSDPSSTMVRILREEPLPLGRFVPNAPPALQAVLNRALAKSVKERYQNAEEFGFDLLGIQRDLKVSAVADLLKRAEVAMQDGDPERGRVLLHDVLRLDRQNDRANRLLREVRQSIQDQQRSSQIEQIRSQAQVALAGGQYEEALVSADQALRLDPTDTRSIQLSEEIRNAISKTKAVRQALNRAEASLFAGDFDEAKEAVEEAVRLDPSDSEARALASMINKELAERSRRAQIQGFVDQARRGIAERKFTDAIDALQRAEEIDPTDSNARELLQWAQRGQEQENRRKHLQEIGEQIEAALHVGDFSAACTISEMGLQRFPDEPILLRLRAISEKQRDIAERRRFVHDQSLAIKALTEQDKLTDAVQVLNDSLQKYPGEPNLESLLAMTKVAIERQQIEGDEAAHKKKATQRLEAEGLAQLNQQVLNWSVQLRRALDGRAALTEISTRAEQLKSAIDGKDLDDQSREVATVLFKEVDARLGARDQAAEELDQIRQFLETSSDPALLNEAENRLSSVKRAFPNETEIEQICATLADSVLRIRKDLEHTISSLKATIQDLETTGTQDLISLEQKAKDSAAAFAADPRVGALLQQIDSFVRRRLARNAEFAKEIQGLLADRSGPRSLEEISLAVEHARSIAALEKTDRSLADNFTNIEAEAARMRGPMESLLQEMAALAKLAAEAPTVHDAEGLVPQVRALAEAHPEFIDLQESANRVLAAIQGERIEHDLIVNELESMRSSVPLLGTDAELAAAAARAGECHKRYSNDFTIIMICGQVEEEIARIQREREELQQRNVECDTALRISEDLAQQGNLEGALESLNAVECKFPDRNDLHHQISLLRRAIEWQRKENEQPERVRRDREKAEVEANTNGIQDQPKTKDDRDAFRRAKRFTQSEAEMPETVSPLKTSPNDQTVIVTSIPNEVLRDDSEKGTTKSPDQNSASPLDQSGLPPVGESTNIFTQGSGGEGAREILPPPPVTWNEIFDPHRPQVMLTFIESADPVLIGRSVPLTKVPFVIGRSEDADLSILSERSISRQHCEVNWENGAYVVHDLSSVNGTWLDGCPLRGQSRILHFGSMIRLTASTLLNFTYQHLPELPDLTGFTIAERFALEELIQSNIKSALYRARDSRLPQYVAVKILSPDLATYPGYLEKFNREAEITATLRHPHIAKMIDSGQMTVSLGPNKVFCAQYVCMEYIAGGSLANRISDKKYFSPNEFAAWLEPIASALGYAHRRGVIHGGLKSTSIIFDDESKPYLADFALASHSGGTDQTFVGTPEFMAPEQWEGMPCSPLTDQYALGILSYYSLTGMRPYEGQANPTTRERNFSHGVIPVHEQAHRLGNLDVPEDLSSVIARAIALKPEDRYPTVTDFALAVVGSMTSSSKKPKWPDVFLSYRRDVASGWATFIAHELRRRGITVFVDTERRDNVGSFPRWLEDSIANCKVFVCLLSSKTLKSKWVYEEIRLANQYGRRMVPIMQEDFRRQKSYSEADVHIESLLTYQGVVLLDRKNEYIGEAIARLVELLGDSVSKRTGVS